LTPWIPNFRNVRSQVSDGGSLSSDTEVVGWKNALAPHKCSSRTIDGDDESGYSLIHPAESDIILLRAYATSRLPEPETEEEDSPTFSVLIKIQGVSKELQVEATMLMSVRDFLFRCYSQVPGTKPIENIRQLESEMKATFAFKHASSSDGMEWTKEYASSHLNDLLNNFAPLDRLERVLLAVPQSLLDERPATDVGKLAQSVPLEYQPVYPYQKYISERLFAAIQSLGTVNFEQFESVDFAFMVRSLRGFFLLTLLSERLPLQTLKYVALGKQTIKRALEVLVINGFFGDIPHDRGTIRDAGKRAEIEGLVQSRVFRYAGCGPSHDEVPASFHSFKNLGTSVRLEWEIFLSHAPNLLQLCRSETPYSWFSSTNVIQALKRPPWRPST
jgi:hypothetical protein